LIVPPELKLGPTYLIVPARAEARAYVLSDRPS